MKQNFHKLYGDIVHTIRVDYAGMGECAESFTPRYYTQAIGQAWNDGVLDELLFLRYVNQMLACTGDRHLRLALLPDEDYAPYSVGFSVRRLGDELVVTEASEEERLAVGDRITAVNGGTPAHHRRLIQKNFFYADEPEREDWSDFLNMAESIDVTGKGTMELRHFPLREAVRMPSLRFVGNAAVFDPGTLDGSGRAVKLLLENEDKLAACERLVWDMRKGGGAREDEIEALLPWLVSEDTDRAELLGDTELYVNYSQRNCSLKAQQLAQVPGAEAYIAELRDKAGSGYVFERLEAEHGTVTAKRRGRVLVLTDSDCRDAGEALVQAARRAGATLVGRATMGTLDYCGDVSALLGGRFVFSWPTAVTADARNGKGMKGIGIVPDVYIPFSAEECGRDVLLDAALNRI